MVTITSATVGNSTLDPSAAAFERLRDAAQELADFPSRLHLAGVQPSDLLGSPRFHPAFLAWLDGGIHQTRSIQTVEQCRREHPIGAAPFDPCAWCGGQGSYAIYRIEYARPFARALWLSARRASKLRPHPVTVVMALIRARFDPELAALIWGERVLSPDHLRTVEARCISAIRSVLGRYERTVLPSGIGWLERSDAQRCAEDAIGA